jgi:hypothetical protein
MVCTANLRRTPSAEGSPGWTFLSKATASENEMADIPNIGGNRRTNNASERSARETKDTRQDSSKTQDKTTDASADIREMTQMNALSRMLERESQKEMKFQDATAKAMGDIGQP